MPSTRAPARFDDPPAQILVAEDDLEMRQLVVDCLLKEGYNVRAVANGGELLALVADSLCSRWNSAALSLLVTDVRMPGCSGIELARKLRAGGIEAPMVIMSAFGDVTTRGDARELGAHFLDKPFKLDTLRSLVRELLAASGVRPLEEH
jgi:DNA-binding response OmpR family regulator